MLATGSLPYDCLSVALFPLLRRTIIDGPGLNPIAQTLEKAASLLNPAKSEKSKVTEIIGWRTLNSGQVLSTLAYPTSKQKIVSVRLMTQDRLDVDRLLPPEVTARRCRMMRLDLRFDLLSHFQHLFSVFQGADLAISYLPRQVMLLARRAGGLTPRMARVIKCLHISWKLSDKLLERGHYQLSGRYGSYFAGL